MADNPAPADTPPRPRGGGRGRANGQRTPGRGNDRSEDTTQADTNRGGRRGGRGRGRGRGRGGYAERAIESTESSSRAGGPSSSDRLPEAASKTEDQEKGKQPALGEPAEELDEEEADVCFICASPIIHLALSPCNHRTCHICALRLRALYKSKACAHCRALSDTVIFTDDAEKKFEEFKDSDFATIDRNLGIKYEKPEIFQDTLVLLRYNCPDLDCDVACLGWPDLHRHVRSVHNKWMCDLCTRHKKVFTHEHELFTKKDLLKHEKFGDDNPGAIDQTGFKGHPECTFCQKRFYGDDELFVHCRDHHEKCHICERRDGRSRPQYYLNYNTLEDHFRKDHFLCPDVECMEKKFVVFDSKIDLNAHQLEAHPNGLTKEARRDARRVDMTSFDQLHQRYQPERGRGRGGRGSRGGGGGDSGGRGRGRDPNSEPLPQSSAQPMSRAELAFQRERAIQSAQSIAPRTFGGRLTAAEPEAYVARPPAQAPAAVTVARPAVDGFPSLASLRPTLATPPTSSSPMPEVHETPQEKARRLQHTAVIERAATMLRNDSKKLDDFRANISSFRNGKITAPELLEAFFALFDRPTAEVGKLIKELAEIFEITSKREELLKSWNDWKAINEDYPSLPGSSVASSSGLSASFGTKRVLKLKTSTAQSARSPVAKTGTWGSTSNSSLFPSLPPGAANRTKASSATPWAGPASNTKQTAAASRPTPQRTTVTSSPSGGGSSDAFPALPAAAKPMSTYFSPGSTSSGILRRNGAPTAPSPWGGSSGTSTPAVEAEDDFPAMDGKKKGNKKRDRRS